MYKVKLITKLTCFVTILAIMPLLCGCGLEKVQEETQLCKTAKEDGKQFFEYLKEEDIQSLSDLFSENEKNKYDLKKEWKAFFEQIDGNFVSYDEMSFDENQRTFYDNQLSKLIGYVEFTNIKTSTGHIYEKMGYSIILKYSYDSKEEGVSGFSLRKERDENGELVMIYVGVS